MEKSQPSIVESTKAAVKAALNSQQSTINKMKSRLTRKQEFDALLNCQGNQQQLNSNCPTINSINTKIQFTIETSGSSIPSLDIFD